MRNRIALVALFIVMLAGIAPLVPGARAQAQDRSPRPDSPAQLRPQRPEPQAPEQPGDPQLQDRYERLGISARIARPVAPAMSAEDLAAAMPQAAPQRLVRRASVDDQGRQTYGTPLRPSISADGRYVTFDSWGRLVQDDNRFYYDVFRRDLEQNTTERVSVSSSGAEGNDNSWDGVMSPDGRYVAFTSWASNLVPGDTNDASDVFVRDLQTGITTRVSLGAGNVQANGDSYDPSISADGRFVAFYSFADNLVSGDTNGLRDVFVHDRNTGQTTSVSVGNSSLPPDSVSVTPAISANGRLVAFVAFPNSPIADDPDVIDQVYLYDRITGATRLVSVTEAGVAGDGASWLPAISSDGSLVAFTSLATNLGGDDTGGHADVFIRDLAAETTVRVSQAADGSKGNDNSYSPAFSGDDATLAYWSLADNLVTGDTNYYTDLFTYDLSSGVNELVTRDTAGNQILAYSPNAPALSDDGRTLAFDAVVFYMFIDGLCCEDVYVISDGPAALHSVSGQVTDQDDNPVPQVLVVDRSGAADFTDENGNYAIANLLPGSAHGVSLNDGYTSAYIDGGPGVPFSLPPDAGGVDLQVFRSDYYFDQTAVATEDAFVDEVRKTTNFGRLRFLNIKNSTKDWISYVKFEPEVVAPPDNGCLAISDSRLNLVTEESSKDAGTVYRVDNNWNERTINWINRPPITGDGLGNITELVYSSAVLYDVLESIEPTQYSFAIHNHSKDSVTYISREYGSDSPSLSYSYYTDLSRRPGAVINLLNEKGAAPMKAWFNGSESYGCPTSFLWDFGDGTTSTERAPTHTFTEPGDYEVKLTVSNEHGSGTTIYDLQVLDHPTLYYLNPAGRGIISKSLTWDGADLAYTSADILEYDRDANKWRMVYRGADPRHNTRGALSAISSDGDDLLLVFARDQIVPGLGTVKPTDIIRFTPDVPGVFPLGSGTYSMEHRGQSMGLTTASEAIDALDIDTYATYDGLYLSTAGKARVLDLNMEDEDISWHTCCYYSSLYFWGEAIPGLASKDINGVWHDEVTGDLYMTVDAPFTIGDGVKGDRRSIIHLGFGSYTPSLVDWLAPGAAAPFNISGIDMRRGD